MPCLKLTPRLRCERAAHVGLAACMSRGHGTPDGQSSPNDRTFRTIGARRGTRSPGRRIKPFARKRSAGTAAALRPLPWRSASLRQGCSDRHEERTPPRHGEAVPQASSTPLPPPALLLDPLPSSSPPRTSQESAAP
eukprot:356435-Chlamydomonas_euryale.AAC.3